MPASLLKSAKAISLTVKGIEIFVKRRDMLSTDKDILLQVKKIEQKLTAHDDKIQDIFQALKKIIKTGSKTAGKNRFQAGQLVTGLPVPYRARFINLLIFVLKQPAQLFRVTHPSYHEDH